MTFLEFLTTSFQTPKPSTEQFTATFPNEELVIYLKWFPAIDNQPDVYDLCWKNKRDDEWMPVEMDTFWSQAIITQ